MFLYANDAKLFRYISKQSDTGDLQKDLNELYEWISKLPLLNISKYKVVSYGRNISFIVSISSRNIFFKKINKAYSVIG